jgi:amino acid transporter
MAEDDRSNEEIKRDRQMIELLNELRVALPGVQIFFAFLLTVPFSNGFGKLNSFQVNVYYVTLMTTTLCAACLIAPSASHRLRFHQNDRPWIIESANSLLIAGLVLLTVAIGCAVLLISDFLFDGVRVWLYTGFVVVVVVWLWFVRPLSRALRRRSSGP